MYDDINHQEYDDENNNDDIEGEEYAMQMLLGLTNYRDSLKLSSLSLSIMTMICHFLFF